MYINSTQKVLRVKTAISKKYKAGKQVIYAQSILFYNKTANKEINAEWKPISQEKYQIKKCIINEIIHINCKAIKYPNMLQEKPLKLGPINMNFLWKFELNLIWQYSQVLNKNLFGIGMVLLNHRKKIYEVKISFKIKM